MKRILLTIFTLALLLNAAEARASNWQAVLDSLRSKMVLIEYYEGISSPESMQGKERIKKHLSGFIVSADGLIITSAAIFRANLEFSGSARFMMRSRKPSHIRIKFEDGEYLPAEFIGKDDDTGLAFIQAKEKKRYSFVHFIKVKDLAVGSRVLFVERLTERFDFQPFMRQARINARLNKAQPVFLSGQNSSAALSAFGLALNEEGQALGLLKQDLSEFEFAPSPQEGPARLILFAQFAKLISRPPVFKEKQTTRKKWLGIYSQPFTRELAAYFKVPELKGILISTVIDDSPAQKAGLKSGDIIISLDGKPLAAENNNDLDTFRQLIRKKSEPGLKLRIYRAGKFLDKKVELGETPISQFLAEEASSNQLGFSVKELTQDIILAKQLNFDTQGVWVSQVERAGWADVAGLRVGDLIIKINEKTVNSLQDIKKEFAKVDKQKPEYVSLFIRRQSDTKFLFIKTNY